MTRKRKTTWKVDDPFDLGDSDAIVAVIRPLLAGYHPAVQGAALAELMATWLAGFPDAMHDDLIAANINAARALVPLCRS